MELLAYRVALQIKEVFDVTLYQFGCAAIFGD
jgi:hypothetical protein